MSAPDKPYVGGQAVIEGVMMRAPRSMAIAVRRPDGSIVVREDAWISIWEHLKFLRWPLLRGSVVLIESLYNGLQALNFAASHAMIDGAPFLPAVTREAEDDPAVGLIFEIAVRVMGPVEAEDRALHFTLNQATGAIAASFR